MTVLDLYGLQKGLENCMLVIIRYMKTLFSSISFGMLVPDFGNRITVLSSDGTWTATENGFVQREASVSHPSTAYATFKIAVNGVTAWATEYSGLTSSGLYEFTSPPLPVMEGDVVLTSSNGSNIASVLYFMPPRSSLS